jgi:hypothetical protein
VQTGVDVAEKSVAVRKGVTVEKAVGKQCESGENVSGKTVAVEKAGAIEKVGKLQN